MYTKQQLIEMDIEIKNLFSLVHTRAAALFEGIKYPWEALAGIKDLILKIGPTLPADDTFIAHLYKNT